MILWIITGVPGGENWGVAMFRSLVVASTVVSFLMSPASASDLRYFGFSNLVSGSDEAGTQYGQSPDALSLLGERGWSGPLPEQPGEIIELRFQGDVRLPDSTDEGARPFASSLTLGLHTHFQRGATDFSFGGGLVMTGPKTGIDPFQAAQSDPFALAPTRQVLDNQIDDGVHPTIVAEVGRNITFGTGANLRPFVEGRLGSETMVRAGFDMTFGGGSGGMALHDPLAQPGSDAGSSRDRMGASFVFGADITTVSDSIYLPEDRGYNLTDSHERVRAGMHWQGEQATVFTGVTYRGKEFESQSDSQVVGSLQINLNF